jgi:hypothetical protein
MGKETRRINTVHVHEDSRVSTALQYKGEFRLLYLQAPFDRRGVPFLSEGMGKQHERTALPRNKYAMRSKVFLQHQSS